MKAYVILGASGGIGSALARRLAARGEERLQELAGDLDGGAEIEIRSVDATDAEAVAGLIDEAAAGGNLAGVANCVGSILLKPAHLTSPAELRETVDLNLGTAFHVVRAAVKPLQGAGGGSIVLYGSAAAETGMANHAPQRADHLERQGTGEVGFDAFPRPHRTPGRRGLADRVVVVGRGVVGHRAGDRRRRRARGAARWLTQSTGG